MHENDMSSLLHPSAAPKPRAILPPRTRVSRRHASRTTDPGMPRTNHRIACRTHRNNIMIDTETIARFVFMRSQGWSFNHIAVELNVSKPTLIKWGRQH